MIVARKDALSLTKKIFNMAQKEKRRNLKFPEVGPDSFHNLVKRRVDEYFASNNIAKTGNKALYLKTIFWFSSFVIAYVGIITIPYLQIESNFVLFCLTMVWYVALGYIIPGIGMGVMHDAAHNSYSQNKRLNKIIAFWSGDAMAASMVSWRIQHNILHHTFTNVDDQDSDIKKYPMFRFSPHHKWLRHHQYQHLYARVLYLFLSISWIINDFTRILITKNISGKEIKISKKQILEMLLGKAIHLGLFTFPLFILPHAWWGIVGFFVMHFIVGYILAITFQLAHVVEPAEFLQEPEGTDELDMPWREHTMRTTANFDPHNKLLTWYVGGLNYQIEHHLFPQISHVHYPAIRQIVKETAQECGQPYHEFKTKKAAKQSHFGHLKLLGQAPKAA